MYKKILVPMDGSEASKHALKAAMESASKWGADIELLTVVPPVSELLYGGMGDIMVNIDAYHEQLVQVHKQFLHEAVEMVKEYHPELKVSKSILNGHVPTKILEESNKDDIDVIVMGSRGLSGIKSWFLGSVSKNVVEHCRKPILIVK